MNNLDNFNNKWKASIRLKSVFLLFCVWVTGCTYNLKSVEADYYDSDHERLKNTDMSSYTIQGFSKVIPLCKYDEDCQSINYGNVGCSGLGGYIIYSTVIGEENINSLVKVATESQHTEGVGSGDGYSVCSPAGPRKPLLYCDDICTDAYAEIGMKNHQIYLLEQQLNQCQSE